MTEKVGTHYAGLIWTLVRTDFKTRYHGTVGGFLWAMVKPLTMFVVLFGVFSLVFSMDPVYNLNLIIGLFIWDFFNESTRAGLISLHSKGYLVTRARFPTWIVVVTSCSNALITLFLFGGLVVSYVVFIRRSAGLVDVLLFAGYLLAFLVIVIGFSLATSALFLRFRDLNQLWELTLQAGFFVAPVIYPLNIIPERFHVFLYLWLPTPVIQFSRSVLVHGVVPSMRAHLMLAASAAVVLATGVLIFWRQGRRVLEEL